MVGCLIFKILFIPKFHKLFTAPGERDMIVMRHDVGVQLADGKEETRHIDFVVYGDPKGYTAMAATVGFPTGIAAKMIIDGWHVQYY